MTTIVDALVLTLGLDNAKFEKGQKDTTASLKRMREDSTTTAKEMQARGKQGAEFFGEMQKGAAALIAVIAGGDLVKFADKTLNSLSGIQRVASAMNLPVEKVQAYTKWIERMGGSAAAAQQTLLGLSQLQASWQQGKIGNDQLYAMSKIGGTANDDPVELARKFAAYAHAASPRQAGQVTRFGMALGFDVDQIAALKRAGASGVTRGMAESPVLSAAQIKKADEAREAYAKLAQELGKNAQELVVDTAGLGKFANALAVLARREPEATKALLALTAAIVVLSNVAAVSWLFRLGGGGKALAKVAPKALGGAGRVLGAAARVAGPLGFLYDVLAPTTANAGEDADIAHNRALWAARRHGGGGHPAAGGDGGGGRQTLASAAAHFQSLGLSPAQALGAAAAMTYGEGGWTAGTKNPISSARGIGQWMRGTSAHPGRQADFEKWAGHSLASSTLDEQWRFIDYEFHHKEVVALRALRASKNASEAIRAYVTRYMRPSPGHDTTRDIRDAERAIHITINAPNGDARAIAHHTRRAVHTALTQQANAGLS